MVGNFSVVNHGTAYEQREQLEGPEHCEENINAPVTCDALLSTAAPLAPNH